MSTHVSPTRSRARSWWAGAACLFVGVLLAGCLPESTGSDGFPSIQMLEARALLRVQGKAASDPESLRERYLSRAYPALPAPTDAIMAVATIRESTIDGFRVLTLVPKSNATNQRLIYTHGGAYVEQMSSGYWDMLARLIEETGATVVVPDYPLAPEHNVRESLQFLEKVYRNLLEEVPANNIIMGGDSAGGGLTLAQLYTYRDLGLPMPGKVFLFSPWVDVTLSNPDVVALEKLDPILSVDMLAQSARWWAAGEDLRSPRLSPTFGDLRGLPPIRIFQGTADLFVSDVRAFAEKLPATHVRINSSETSAGVLAKGSHGYFEYPGSIHAFSILPFFPEGQDVYARVGAFVREDAR